MVLLLGSRFQLKRVGQLWGSLHLGNIGFQILVCECSDDLELEVLQAGLPVLKQMAFARRGTRQ